ncbi:MAG TPA: hypothetical protein PLJ25_07320 [Methanothrix sp.]|nr:hypothetical protein [Methanothrix sp.]
MFTADGRRSFITDGRSVFAADGWSSFITDGRRVFAADERYAVMAYR